MDTIQSLLRTQSDIVLGILCGSIITFITGLLGQFLYYHCIEKGKFRNEREFSFKKEQYFRLQEKGILIIKYMGIINKYTLADVSSERGTFKDILENFGEIEAIIYIDFPDLKEDYNKYMNTISEALYGKKESSYTNSCLYYKKLLDELEKTIETYRCEFLK